MKKALLITFAFITLGCTMGKQNPQVSFVLQPSIATIPCTRKLNLYLSTIEADEPYDTPLIAYSPTPLELEFYAYHRWAAPLPKLVAQVVRESLKRWGCVTLVTFGHQIPILQGRIIRFLHRIQGDTSWGEVAIQFSLLRGEKMLAQKTLRARVQAGKNGPEGGVEALNQAFGEVIGQLLKWLEQETPEITGGE